MLTLVADCYGRLIVFPLRDDLQEIRAGSLPDNTIYLPYKGVSRHHFSLVRSRTRWLVKDLGSKNGTLVNGKMITEAPVNPGDVIQAGIIQLEVKSSYKDMQPVQRSETLALTRDPETDKIGHVPITDKETIFSFPKLVFPDRLIPGKSLAMQEVFQKLQAISDSDVNVLLYGETGVGKEMYAQTLHLSGKRSHGSFIAVNCAAIPADLAEAELFGIGEKVATDVNQRKGKMALAHQGTLFLDEISSFPMELQAKVLRAIEEKKVYAVGEHRVQEADFRLISASNQEPKKMIQNGKLREDLYHRISTVEIHIPPLRERTGDIEVLIMGLLHQISSKEGKFVPGISKRLFAQLCGYAFPGNVRELVNILSSMVALAHPGEVLDLHLLPDKMTEAEEPGDIPMNQDSIDFHRTIDDVTRKLVTRALKLHAGNIARAAKSLNVTPFGLRKMMKRLNIS